MDADDPDHPDSEGGSEEMAPELYQAVLEALEATMCSCDPGPPQEAGLKLHLQTPQRSYMEKEARGPTC